MYDYSKEHNRVDLVRTSMVLTPYEFKKFEKKSFMDYDIIQTWDNEHFQEAEKELENYRCSYRPNGQLFDVEEYALIFYSIDEDGNECGGAVDFITAEDEEWEEDEDEE